MRRTGRLGDSLGFIGAPRAGDVLLASWQANSELYGPPKPPRLDLPPRFQGLSRVSHNLSSLSNASFILCFSTRNHVQRTLHNVHKGIYDYIQVMDPVSLEGADKHWSKPCEAQLL